MCEYCEPPYKDLAYLKPLEFKVFIDRTGRLWLRHYDKTVNMTLAAFNTMNYCPKCGRKLTEEK